MSPRTATEIPAPDPFANLLGYQIRRLSILVMADIGQALVPLDLKPAEASVLYAIGANGGLSQSDIGKTLGIQRANMAPLIAGLMQRDLVVRNRVDGRSQALRLTDKGETLRAAAWAVTAAHEDRMFGMLNAAHRTRLSGQLRSIWQNLEVAP